MVLRTASEAARFAEEVRLSRRRLGLVPTMGFLHAGHLALMREARTRADAVAVSVFVNPTQFGPDEDFARYPRDLEGDLAKSAAAGVDAVFAPEPSEIYPPGHQTFVEVTRASRGLCGDRRPGHFRGVATVVTQLFALFRPHVSVFGEKDFQQLAVIRALARDLHLGVEVVGHPIVREPDGLAWSSRNAHLSADERRRALGLVHGLRVAQQLAAQGVRDRDPLVAAVRDELVAAQLREDYVELVDAETLAPLARTDVGAARLLVAAFAGMTRLIDNVELPSAP